MALSLQEKFTPITQNLLRGYQCDTTTLPGRSLATNDIRRMSPTPRIKMAYEANFTDLTVSYYVGGATEEHARNLMEFFTSWQQYIYNTQDDAGNVIDNEQAYTLAYYDDYTTTAKIYLLPSERTNDVVLTYNFFGLYPITVSDIPLSWHEDNTPMKLNVTFTYQSWTTS